MRCRFRFRDGEQLNGVPVAEAVDQIAAFVAGRSQPLAVAWRTSRPIAAERAVTGTAGRGLSRRQPYEFAGVPDAFQRLWTPHRMVYIGGEGKPESDAEQHCPFCDVPNRSDEDGLIVARGELVFAVLNLYPYNPGHLMVVPYRHIADYTELTGPRVGGAGGLHPAGDDGDPRGGPARRVSTWA